MDNRQTHANYLTNEEKAIEDELQESYRQQRRHGNNEEQESSRIVYVLNVVPFTPPRLLNAQNHFFCYNGCTIYSMTKNTQSLLPIRMLQKVCFCP